MCRRSELWLATGITEFLVKVNKGKWEVNKFLLEALFGPLRLGRSWHLASLAFRLQPFSLVSDLEERGCEICEALPSGWNIIENEKKKIWKDAGNSASWTQVRNFNFILFELYLLVLATAWPLNCINCICLHVITILVYNWIQLWYTGLILGLPLFNKVAHCVTAWSNVPCLDNITTYWTMVLPPLSDIDCSVTWPDVPWHMVIYHVLNCPHWFYTTCGMELMRGDRVAGSKLTWTWAYVALPYHMVYPLFNRTFYIEQWMSCDCHTSWVFSWMAKVPCVKYIYLLDVTCGMELMHGGGVAGSKLTWT